MSLREPEAFFFDALRAALRIQRFVRGADESRYAADVQMHSAVERQFTIIGEALSQLRKFAPERLMTIHEAPRIIGFRNVLIHGYAEVDHSEVWSFILQKLPVLIDDLRATGMMDPQDTDLKDG